MSHFSKIQTLLNNRECLVQALIDLELQPQVYDRPQQLTGYYGSQDEHSAEIVVPGYSIQAGADIGFKWNAQTKVYDVIHDSYETITRLGNGFFTHKLMEKYGERVIRAKAAELSDRFGECTIASSREATKLTLRLTFAAHQQVQHHTRR